MSKNLPVRIKSKAKNHTELDVSVRGHSLKVDEPKELGGGDTGPNPLEYFFTGLAGCLNVTVHKVAEERGVEVESLDLVVEGHLDTEGFEDSESDKRSGFEEIEVKADLETDSDESTEREILEEAEERCPVSDNVQQNTELYLEMV